LDTEQAKQAVKPESFQFSSRPKPVAQLMQPWVEFNEVQFRTLKLVQVFGAEKK
jgi:hypothetical protein